MLRNQIRAAIVMTLALCAVTGVVYPGVVTALAQSLFPRQANGSLVSVNGRVVGSTLIGQSFTQAYYFHPRPSATRHDAAASAATNKGPTDSTLAAAVAARADSVRAREGVAAGRLPADMLTASASGIDPHISPASARLQVARVARARGADSAAVRALVDRHTEGRQFGILGEPRVNVLLLNVALDSLFPRPGT
ncbi:MAG TPA: potassium-transporting ATPase subunit KdpC [Gemmatimonadaceae bacterium]|nr:potassium-transporting ATPase subunit KdpC [Gemmatimonadaceae bacterium]